MSEQREFWITKRKMGNYHCHETLAFAEHKIATDLKKYSPRINSEVFHVIQFSAFEAIQKENAELKEYAKKLEYDIENNVSDLKIKLDKVVAALKWQRNYVRNYCIFLHPLKNKDGLETDNHMILQIENILKEIGVE
jgi:hypothetical protein